MDRVDVEKRPAAVLTMLEARAEAREHNDHWEWMPGPILEREIGINWKVGLNKLEHKKKPYLGLGFRIGRRPMKDGSGQWKYRLEAYPINWDSRDRVSLAHIQEEGKQPKPVPRGQQGLFGAPAVI